MFVRERAIRIWESLFACKIETCKRNGTNVVSGIDKCQKTNNDRAYLPGNRGNGHVWIIDAACRLTRMTLELAE